MEEELDSVQWHGTREVAAVPVAEKIIITRFVFKRKLNDDRTIGK